MTWLWIVCYQIAGFFITYSRFIPIPVYIVGNIDVVPMTLQL